MNIDKIFWLLWSLSLILLIVISIRQFAFVNAALFLMLVLQGILYFQKNQNLEVLERIEKKVDKINFNPINVEIKKLREEHTEDLMKYFKFEMEFDKHLQEEENRYRELVKKILEVDNKLNEKHELLGKAILKLSKDIKG